MIVSRRLSEMEHVLRARVTRASKNKKKLGKPRNDKEEMLGSSSRHHYSTRHEVLHRYHIEKNNLNSEKNQSLKNIFKIVFFFQNLNFLDFFPI